MVLLNIAVAGAGLIGLAHIERIQQSTECRLCAIVDPSPNAQQIADQYKVPLFTSLQALFASQMVDGIMLATPNKLHVEQALECINQGIPTFIEKPVSQNLAEGEVLLKQVQKCGAKVLVGHHRTYSSLMEQARSALDRGVVGRPVAVMGSALFYKPDHYYEQGVWRTQKGGGPILLNLIHEIGNLRYLLGDIIAVQAMSSNAVRQFEVEDTTAITLQFATGALGTFLLSDTAASARSWEQTAQENKTYASYSDENCYHIAGTQGSLSVPTMRVKRYGQGVEKSWWSPFECFELAIQRNDPLVGQLSHFCHVIRGEETPRVSVKDGLQNLLVVDAIMKAVDAKSLIQVATID